MGTLIGEGETSFAFFNATRLSTSSLNRYAARVELSFMPTAIGSPKDVFHYRGNITPLEITCSGSILIIRWFSWVERME